MCDSFREMSGLARGTLTLLPLQDVWQLSRSSWDSYVHLWTVGQFLRAGCYTVEEINFVLVRDGRLIKGSRVHLL